MNIFSQKLIESEERKLPIDPIELYQNCQYADGYAYLRGIQEEVLKTWHDKRQQRDIICKMNTGSGKTLTGLLMLYSKMIEKNEPVMFVCPDNQLVEQTIKQAKYYGIPVCEAKVKAQLPPDFLNSKKILVCTFAKLFNGKSIFNRNQIKIAAVVLDDAHKCVDIAREQTSLKLPRTHSISKSLFSLFQESLTYQQPGSLRRLTDGDPSLAMKVPYWTWMDNHVKILEIINNYIQNIDPSDDISSDDGIRFKWNFMSDNLLSYECYVGGDTIEINPNHAPYHEVPTFSEADHRYVLSATFEDDYDLLKDLGIEYQSILNPIVPKDRKDVGRRLILAPTRFDPQLTDTELRNFIGEHKKEELNIVVLVPSTQRTIEWTKIGATYVDKNNIEDALKQLSTSQGHFMVFNNKYDGIDLNGNHCRVLVIDGLPISGSVQELYSETRQDIMKAGKRAQKIEQGLGRAVRSGSDFCVVYAMGLDLISFLGLEKNLSHFTPVTRGQLKLGLKLLDNKPVTNSLELIKETASYCLTQNADWIRFHSGELTKIDSDDANIKRLHFLELAEIERKALALFNKRLYSQAAQMVLDNAVNKLLIDSPKEKGWYYQFAAQLVYLGDKALSNDLQGKACEFALGMFHPPHGYIYKKILRKNGSQPSLVLRYLAKFERPQDILVHIHYILEGLQYIPEISAKIFESRLEELGKLLGFTSYQPELNLGKGPDVIWILADGHYLILEAKSRAIHDEISKDNSKQLLHSIEWFKQQYHESSEFTAVTLQNALKKGDAVTITDTMKVLDKEALNDLRQNLLQFGNSLQSVSPKAQTVENISTLLEVHSFTSTLFRRKYLRKIL
ncbi:DEAD/DEAH box helicase [Dyadobacter sp. LHD-138]|uniref:DEAD/DEAH box helicase n=1 Tax=Dyadobacter sp. LHD-138 TaxID=3071413 RepID=UPI0027E1C04B|nr:DEAD/DEAH box helicase [Dyadobacter sp. LHD-138]MDQ6482572.1 DEAD/DEAH box helicase [Dyadobacter sp. LHD-138]